MSTESRRAGVPPVPPAPPYRPPAAGPAREPGEPPSARHPLPGPRTPAYGLSGPFDQDPGDLFAPGGPFASRPSGRPRSVAAAVCLILGLGLVMGALTGSWLSGGTAEPRPERPSFAAVSLWHSVPVDTLFPRTVEGEGAGPGGADRRWTRIAVAPDSGCADAFDPLLREALAPVGCARLLRATYTDATSSHVTTVGLLFTEADAQGMAALRARFEEEGLDRRTDLMPRPYAVVGTPAAGFGVAQRASWSVGVLTDVPAVVYAVSGFADGRAVDAPQPAGPAMVAGATTAPAQSGLGHEAKGLADRIERGLRRAALQDEERSR